MSYDNLENEFIKMEGEDMENMVKRSEEELKRFEEEIKKSNEMFVKKYKEDMEKIKNEYCEFIKKKEGEMWVPIDFAHYLYEFYPEMLLFPVDL